MRVNIGGSWKPVVSAKINVGGTLKPLVKSRVNVGGTIKAGDTFYTALSATASDSTPSGRTFGSNPVQTNTVTITPAGGIAPYTYSWSRLSGSGSALTPSSASTKFQDTVTDYDTTTGTFRCVVTDSHSSTVNVDVTATFNNFGPIGP